MRSFDQEPAWSGDDQRVRLHSVSFDQYEAVLAMRGEKSVPRISYLDGELEIMSPSRKHETIKTLFARLVEAYADEVGVDLIGAGSWTLKERKEEAGAEPDECYILGEELKDRPDFAIEVVNTSGGISKLEIYKRLRVQEVWFWEAGRIQIYELAEGGEYEKRPQSKFLPELDLGMIASFLFIPNQSRAVRSFRAALRESRGH